MYFYNQNYIYFPHHSMFFEMSDYYQILFHEIGHHEFMQNPRFDKGNDKYEDLAVELAGLYLCALLEIQPTEHQTAYYILEDLNDSEPYLDSDSLLEKALRELPIISKKAIQVSECILQRAKKS